MHEPGIYAPDKYSGPRYRTMGVDPTKDTSERAYIVGGSSPSFLSLDDAVRQAREYIAQGHLRVDICFMDENGGAGIPEREWDQPDEIRSSRERNRLRRNR